MAYRRLQPRKKKSEAGGKQAKYEKEERRRAFLPSWQKNRPWLKFVPASLSASATSQTASAGGNMFCEICQSASQLDRSLAQKNVFVDAGCTSLRLESIKIHETSSNHLKAITIVAAKSEPVKKPFFTYNSPLLKGQPKFCQGKHVFWKTCPADDFEKKMNMDPWGVANYVYIYTFNFFLFDANYKLNWYMKLYQTHLLRILLQNIHPVLHVYD